MYTTPKSYLELIELYKVKLDSSKSAVVSNKERLEEGLKKLNESR